MPRHGLDARDRRRLRKIRFLSVPQIALARPKSSTFTLPCGVTLTLAGFRSR